MAPMKITSILVIKFKRPKYEQKYLADYEFMNEVNLNVFCTICRCDLRIAHGFRVDIKMAKFSAAEISAANIHKNLL